LALPDGTSVQPLAVKIQKDAYRPLGGALAARTVPNREIDDMWRRQRENLVRARAPQVARFFDLIGEGPTGPITYCKTTRQFFRPLCPETLAPLVLCRDDALLRDCGLEPYGETAKRFLFSPARVDRAKSLAAGAEDKLTFYTWSATAGRAPRRKAVVRRRTELYRDAAILFDRDLPEAARQRLAAEFPCWTCEHQAECYAKPAESNAPLVAEQRLVPLTFYGTHLLAIAAQHLQFDEFCDLLGGATWDQAVGELGLGSQGRAALLEPIKPLFARSPRWLHELDAGQVGNRRLALEVLYLKLTAIAQLGRGLQVFHESCLRPHLGVAPDHVMVQVPDAGPGLPVRWGFSVSLLEGGATRRFVPAGLDSEGHLELLVPIEAPGLYSSPLVDQTDFELEVNMRLRIEQAVAKDTATQPPQLVVEGTTQDRLSGFAPGDLVQVTPHSPLPGLGESALLGVVERLQQGKASLTVFLGHGQSVSATALPLVFEANVAFYRRYQPPCDLYGLGMMLWRALLVHDQRDPLAVQELVRRILDRFAVASAAKAKLSPQQLRTRLHTILHEQRDALHSAAVLYRATDREGNDDPLPGDLWVDCLDLGLRLMSNVPGFGFCAGHSDHDAERPGALLQCVLVEVEELCARTRVELFGRTRRGAEINAACDGLLLELEGGGAALGAATPREHKP
jgi:hypothetical protein